MNPNLHKIWKNTARVGLWSAAAAVSSFLFVGLLGCCSYSASAWRGPVSDHFDGERFFNQEAGAKKGLKDVLAWGIKREPPEWKQVSEAEPGPKPPERVDGDQIRVTFVNHSTFLVQVDGLNILTDPIWSERASPVSWAGPKRVRRPGIRFADLPPIHAVLISHNHYDHMDLDTLQRIQEAHRAPVYVGLGNQANLADEGISGAVDLDWWQSAQLSPQVRVTFVPARHFSSRGLCDRNVTLWGGFVIEGSAKKVYFAGDTGFGKHFAQIRKRFGPPDLALLPIGAFLPRWFMGPVHMSPAEAVKAHRILEARKSLGMHFGTFPLADDEQDQPVLELAKALMAADIPQSRFSTLDFGQGLLLSTRTGTEAEPVARLLPEAVGDRLPPR